ncbi:hypothetical protein ACS0TY_019112 [Phlomoides rotata]
MGAPLPSKESDLFKRIVGLKAADAILKKFPDHGGFFIFALAYVISLDGELNIAHLKLSFGADMIRTCVFCKPAFTSDEHIAICIIKRPLSLSCSVRTDGRQISCSVLRCARTFCNIISYVTVVFCLLLSFCLRHGEKDRLLKLQM